jgi:hypothetical protein
MALIDEIPFRARIYAKKLGIPVRILPENMIVRILRTKIRWKKWIVGSGCYSYWLGIYEPEMRSVFEKSITKGSIVF